MKQERVYFPGVPPDLIHPFRRGLARQLRWIGSPTPPTRPENVLSHQFDVYDLSYDTRDRYPTLEEEFDWDGPTGIIDQDTVHDVGEIIRGDLALSRQDYFIVRNLWKRKERQAAHWIFRNFIGDLSLRKRAQASYDRNYYCAPDDKEAHMAKMLNMIQGIRVGLESAYNGLVEPSEAKIDHVEISVSAFFRYAEPLVGLVSDRALPELMEFLTGELEGYRKAGYPDVADQAIRRLTEISESRMKDFAVSANV